MQVAKFFCHDEISNIPVTIGGSAMPAGSVYMAPGVYTFGGQSWDCTRAGLYRFKLESEPFFRNRIVYSALPNPDLYSLLSAVCWNHAHGSADETSDYQSLSNKGRSQRWRLRCGVIVGMMVWVLPQFSITARSVNVYSLAPWPDGIDNGHIVLETKHGNDWRMWDLTNGCYWTDANGNHLSTAQFITHIANNGPMPNKVMLDPTDKRWDAEVVAVTGGVLDLGIYGELVIAPGEEAWFRHKFQAIV